MTCHEVRKMHLCSVCGNVGIHAPKDSTTELEIVIAVSGVYAHPRCYQRKYGLKGLLSVEDGELENIRLCDVSLRTMVALVRRGKNG